MKKFLFFVVFMPLLLHGQDVIVTRNAEEIEAVVERIGEEEIEYRMWNFQEGPKYVISREKVSVIRFRNGTEQTFNDNRRLAVPDDNEVSFERLNANGMMTGDRHGNLYLDGVRLSDLQAEHLLTVGDVNYYNTWLSGHKQFKNGKIFLGVGLGLFVATGALMYYAYNDWESSLSMSSFPDYTAAYICAVPADVFLCLGFVYKGIGRSRRNSVVDRYNNQIRRNREVSELLVGPTSAGFGLTYTF